MKKHATILGAALLAMSLSSHAFADGLTVIIGTPPPAPIVEAAPAPPGPPEEFVWRAGYWRWVDERHVWIPGHWAHRPHPRAEWVAPTWEQHPEGYHFHEGHWQ
jgi:hypothetical protein